MTEATAIDYAAAVAGGCDVLLVTLDALRLDAARLAKAEGRTPHLSRLLPGGWEARHSPGSFTYAAHAALFAGFWPTPAGAADRRRAGALERPFAVAGVPSRSVGPRTCRLPGASVPEGLAARGYRTVCVGGVGFFDGRSPLGRQFPALFEASRWEADFAPTSARAPAAQSAAAAEEVTAAPADRPLLLFLNASATHPPTRLFAPPGSEESVATQAAAAAAFDRPFGGVLAAFAGRRRPLLAFVTSDHGTAFGDDGYQGHRLAHPAVWLVPYAERLLSADEVQSLDDPVRTGAA